MSEKIIKTGKIEVKNIAPISIVLGRNGTGKSRLLREIYNSSTPEEYSGVEPENKYNIRYVSPERAGVFKRQGHVDSNIRDDPNYYRSSRSKNQSENFKSLSATYLRDIKDIYLQKLQDTPSIRYDSDRTFERDRLERINKLFTNIKIEQENQDFVFKSHDGELISPEDISSGESEAVTLAVEILYFFETVVTDNKNILLLDEPDVHLHPDLQARLATFIIGCHKELDAEKLNSVYIFIATHSSSLVCALSTYDHTSIGTKEYGKDIIEFTPASYNLKKLSPFFGHPLSLTLNNETPIILEGEDDERVWQQAYRSSQGRIKLFPVLARSVDQQSELETFCSDILPALYDSPKAFSLRDGDGKIGCLNDVGIVKRFRLNCYAIENLLLSDDCLSLMNTNWEEFIIKCNTWLEENKEHKYFKEIQKIVKSTDRYRNSKIKDIRHIICSIAECNKPWEVVVGQAIGQINSFQEMEYSIYSMIGDTACDALLNIQKNK